jgi:hypothetical protein
MDDESTQTVIETVLLAALPGATDESIATLLDRATALPALECHLSHRWGDVPQRTRSIIAREVGLLARASIDADAQAAPSVLH